jgi:putative DNA primase/helicase
MNDHSEILRLLIEQLQRIDFRKYCNIEQNKEVTRKHLLVAVVENVLKTAKANNWGIARQYSFFYLFNGEYWSIIKEHELENFLGEAAEKMGIDAFEARSYLFREQLLKQFLTVANFVKLARNKDKTLINLKNGTFEISADKQFLREPKSEDFITYQLPFEYNPDAIAPVFQSFLDRVVPEVDKQKILAEYVGYVFIKNEVLKLEKILLLYGTGANGKSVFFEIISSLLGEENISSYSLQNLTDNTGYYRAKLANKLLNYASEINGKLESSIFKQLTSGEPVEARSPYGEPFTLTEYGRMIFNCNELPREVEQTNAFFRRFLIIHFAVAIPEKEQNKGLAQYIIRNELSGVFNWVLDGLKRLMIQKNFTQSKAVEMQVEEYKKQSDNVRMFISEGRYKASKSVNQMLKDLYVDYKSFCEDYCYITCSNRTFGERLRNIGFAVERKNKGVVVYVEKE